MKRVMLFLLQVVALLVWVFAGISGAAEASLLKSRVVDVDGRPVEGVKLFLYNVPDTRRPADFISPRSDRDGRIQITVPPGKYWIVARLKVDEKYGPLMPGDKHSGEPIELELAGGSESENDFVVADIREVGRKKRTSAADVLKVQGRILDGKGNPVANAYVFAGRAKQMGQIPDFLSAWTGADGTYTLFLPVGGAYFVGGGKTFPPPRSGSYTELLPEPGKLDIALDIELTLD